MLANYTLTLLGLLLAVALYVTSLVVGLDLFEAFVALLEVHEQNEFDELLFPLLILLLFTVADMRRRSNRRKAQAHMEKLKVYRATVHASHDILNDFISQMHAFKITAENTPGFSTHILAMYDEVIEDANKKLRDLGRLDEVSEESIRDSVK